MKRRIIHSTQAEIDLARIYKFIELDSFTSAPAERYLDKIIEEVEMLAEFPDLGSLRPDFTDNPDIRFFPVQSHHIVYKFDDETLIILRILHGAQDLPNHLQNE